ncbi:MAG: hypothetical protein ABI282_11225 [Candidatus Baltobacteraceae bacterium]
MATAFALTACSSHKTVISSDGSSVTTSDNGKTATIDTKDGSVTVGADVDPAKLGAPVYPGATKSDQGSIAVNASSGANVLASFKTPDSFDKVYAFYKAQLPSGAEKMKIEESGSSMASFQIADAKSGEQTSVMVEGKDGETDILITHGSGQFGSSASPSDQSTP